MVLYRLTHFSLAFFSRGHWQTVQNQILKINESHNIKLKKAILRITSVQAYISINAYNLQLNSIQKLCGTGFSQLPLLYVVVGPTSLWESYF